MKTRQISDSLSCGIILALSGGCMDAYSYLFRDHVFANAQTGNMLLLGVNLAEGRFSVALTYLWPILAFVAGIMLSDLIRTRGQTKTVHWRQIVVAIEAAALFAVAFIPGELNNLANAMISLACGMQVESFRTIHGNAIATTMCIGNLRSGTFYLDKFLHSRERQHLQKAALYYGIILSFILGAVLESILIRLTGTYAIMLSSVLLVLALVYMFRYGNEENEQT